MILKKLFPAQSEKGVPTDGRKGGRLAFRDWTFVRQNVRLRPDMSGVSFQTTTAGTPNSTITRSDDVDNTRDLSIGQGVDSRQTRQRSRRRWVRGVLTFQPGQDPAVRIRHRSRASAAGTVSGFSDWRRSAADLAGRPSARDKTTRRGCLPWLIRPELGYSCGSRRFRLRRSSGRFCRRFGPRVSRLCVVPSETAMFVFSAGAAMTGLVASRSCSGRCSH